MITRDRKAFTLIELLIAMAILVIGAVGILLVIPAAQRTAGQAALMTRATMVGSQAMEELKAKGYDVLSGQPAWSGDKEEFHWDASVVQVKPADFADAVTLPAERFLKIDITVTYSVRGKQREEHLTTLFGEL